MSLVEQAIIIDAANLSVILLGVGLLATQLLKRWPLVEFAPLPAQFNGRVQSRPFDTPELILAFALIGIYYFSVWLDVRAEDIPKAIVSSWRILGGYLNMGVVFAIIIVMGFVRQHDLVELWGLDRMNPKNVVISSVMLVLSTVLTLLVMQLFYVLFLKDAIGEAPAQESIQQLRKDRSLGMIVTLIISACIIAPILEEVLFRGFLYPVLKRFTPPIIAALIVSGIFAAVHSNLGGLVPLGVLSLMLILVYEITGTLWSAMLVHAGFNLCNIIMVLSESPTTDG
ncbi:MAG: CPBP family intramembrane glutamic endopeptidase [Verrucomicrobiota bacterium]